MTNNIQSKLFHYQIEPPEGAWDNIACALDNDISSDLSERLFEYEETPQNETWEKISSALSVNGNSQKGTVIPFYQRYRRHIKYGSSVAIFAAVAVVVSLFINKRTESNQFVQPPVTNVIDTPAKKPAHDTTLKTPVNPPKR